MSRLLYTCFLLALITAVSPAAKLNSSLPNKPLTPAPNGPYRVQGKRILDREGKPYLLRATQLPPLSLVTLAENSASGATYGSYTATTLSAARLRFNLNAVVIPVTEASLSDPDVLLEVDRLIHRANSMHLTAILSAPAKVEFWDATAKRFAGSPNLFFRLESQDPQANNAAKIAIRQAGANQPIISSDSALADSNTILDLPAATHRMTSSAALEAYFVAERPIFASSIDFDLVNKSNCSTLPADPSDAARFLRAQLSFFDAQSISWSASELSPGRLVKDLAYHDATSLEDGWTCGESKFVTVGIGRVIESYLRGTSELGTFVVGASGGMEIARGGYALAYGPIFADHDQQFEGPVAPTQLGGLRVEVIDSKGTARAAGLLWASQGWGQTNFVIPAASAPGPARIRLVRSNGSTAETPILIGDVAPGFITGHSCRGPVIGFREQNGKQLPLSECNGIQCRTLSIPVSASHKTVIRLEGSGFRHARSADELDIRVNGERLPVVAYGPADAKGRDFINVEVPSSLAQAGETDMVCHLRGRVSNAVRIRFSPAL